MTVSSGQPNLAPCALPQRRRTGSAAWSGLLAVALLIVSQPAWSVTCSSSATGVSFGNYSVFSNADSDSAGSVSVSCDGIASYSIALSPGNGTYSARRMASGTNHLDYNLYREASRSTVWGDGTSGSSVVTGSGTAATHTVYGRIPSRQNVYAGSYSDNIVVTVSY